MTDHDHVYSTALLAPAFRADEDGARVPASADALLRTVHGRARSARRRGLAVRGAAAVVLLGAAGFAGTALTAGGTATGPAVRTSTPATSAATGLVPVTLQRPALPMALGYLPAALDGVEQDLRYLAPNDPPTFYWFGSGDGKGHGTVEFAVAAATAQTWSPGLAPGTFGDGTEKRQVVGKETVTVAGGPATLWTITATSSDGSSVLGRSWLVAWRSADGQDRMVFARDLADGRAEVLRTAGGVSDGATAYAGDALVRPGLAPAGWTATAAQRLGARLTPADRDAARVDIGLEATAELDPAADKTGNATFENVSVAGRPGRLARGDGAQVLQVQLAEGRYLVVAQYPATAGATPVLLPTDELVAIAAAVVVDPAAAPA